MEYLIAGPGGMPRPEIKAVLNDIITSDDEAVFSFLWDKDVIDRSVNRISQATAQSIYQFIADHGMADEGYYNLVRSESDVDLVTVPGNIAIFDDDTVVTQLLVLCPGSNPEQDQDWDMYPGLIDLVQGFTEEGVKSYAFNEQMYELVFAEEEGIPIPEEQADTPVEDAPPVFTVTDPDVLGEMTRDELKRVAKGMGVTPTDWRSRDAILAAVQDAMAKDGGLPLVENEAIFEEVAGTGEAAEIGADSLEESIEELETMRMIWLPKESADILVSGMLSVMSSLAKVAQTLQDLIDHQEQSEPY